MYNPTKNPELADFYSLKASPPRKSPSNLRKSHIRWLALFLVCINGVGDYYSYDNPQSLETVMTGKLGLTNFQFNMLYSVYSLPNILIPFFGGMLIDKLGGRLGVNVCSFLLIVGQLVFTLGATDYGYPFMLMGRVIYGLGGETLMVAQSAVIVKWFRGKELAFALGAIMCIGNFGSSFNSFFAPKLYEWTGKLAAPLLLGVFLCFLSWVSGLWLNYYDRKADLQDNISRSNDEIPSNQVSLKDLKSFPVIYYLILFNFVFLYGGYYSLNNNINDLMVQRFGFTETAAGDVIPIIYLFGAVAIPMIGMYSDHKGKRALLMLIAAVILMVVHLFLVFLPNAPPDEPNYTTIVLLIGLGAFYSIYASTSWPCVSLVVQEKLIGTAYGIITASNNLVSTILPLAVGAVQDYTIGVKHGYFWTEILLGSLVACGIMVSIWIYYEDLRNGGKLNKPVDAIDEDETDLKSGDEAHSTTPFHSD